MSIKIANVNNSTSREVYFAIVKEKLAMIIPMNVTMEMTLNKLIFPVVMPAINKTEATKSNKPRKIGPPK